MSSCAVVWCDRPASARGLCARCYERYRRGIGPNDIRTYAARETRERVRAEVTRRRKAGESISDIARSVGVHSSTLGKWFREWGICPSNGGTGKSKAFNQSKRWTRDDAVFAITRTDLSIADRAEHLGRSYSSVTGFIRDYRQRDSDPFGIK